MYVTINKGGKKELELSNLQSMNFQFLNFLADFYTDYPIPCQLQAVNVYLVVGCEWRGVKERAKSGRGHLPPTFYCSKERDGWVKAQPTVLASVKR